MGGVPVLLLAGCDRTPECARPALVCHDVHDGTGHSGGSDTAHSATSAPDHTGCPYPWGCDPRPTQLGVDVRSRPSTTLMDATTQTPSGVWHAGRSLAVGVVGGVPMVIAALPTGAAVESFPSDGRWDFVRFGNSEEIGYAAGLADWSAPMVTTGISGDLYTNLLADGLISSLTNDGSESRILFPDVDGYAYGGGLSSLEVVDLDADGVDDLLMSFGDGRVGALRGPPGFGRDVWPEPMFELYGRYPPHQNFGYFVGEVGDLTGDGLPEMTFYGEDDDVGGRVWIVPLGPLPRYAEVHTVGWSLVNDEPYASAGRSIAIGDVTGDGVNDVVTGAPLANDRAGMVFVYPGPVTGDGRLADSVARIAATEPWAWCGRNVEVLQDQDGDGHDEVVVGCEGGGDEPGRVMVFSGADVVGDLDVDDAALVLHTVNDLSAPPGDLFGYTLQADVDLTGDGLQDLVIGAPGEVRDGQLGGVYVLHSPVIP
jgi:hypothetical protein